MHRGDHNVWHALVGHLHKWPWASHASMCTTSLHAIVSELATDDNGTMPPCGVDYCLVLLLLTRSPLPASRQVNALSKDLGRPIVLALRRLLDDGARHKPKALAARAQATVTCLVTIAKADVSFADSGGAVECVLRLKPALKKEAGCLVELVGVLSAHGARIGEAGDDEAAVHSWVTSVLSRDEDGQAVQGGAPTELVQAVVEEYMKHIG